MARKGTISKDRVKKNGEVFTPDETVNDMLDLLDNSMANRLGVSDSNSINDFTYIDDTRLEPTCGDGSILVRILDRKLGRVQKIKEQGGNWKEALLRSVASIYGVDITADNVVMSKRRMLDVIENGSTAVLSLADETPVDWQSDGFELDNELRKLVQLILDYNIQCGNTLTGEQYKIYCTGFDCWTCSIDLVGEKHIYRNKVDDNGKEIEGWETQKDVLWITQWKFEDTQYINRQCAFNEYKDYMECGQTFLYTKTKPLELYCKHVSKEEKERQDKYISKEKDASGNDAF